MPSPFHCFQWEVWYHLTFVSLYIMCRFFLAAFKMFFLSLVMCNLIMTFLVIFFFISCVWSFLSVLDLWVYSFGKFWPLFLQVFLLAPPFLSFRDFHYPYVRLLEIVLLTSVLFIKPNFVCVCVCFYIFYCMS